MIESWLNERSTNETRGTIFSIYTVINLTVITVGQMMLSLADPRSFALFALASILVSLAALPVAFTTSVSPAPVPVVRPKLAKLCRISPVGVAGCLAVGLVNGSFWTLGPVFAQDLGFDTAGVGLFMSAVVLGGALSQWPFGLISDRIDRRLVMIISSSIAIAAAIVIMTFVHDPTSFAILAAACFGFGAFPLYALSVAHTNGHADPNDYVAVSSTLLLVLGVGAVIGPFITGLLQQNISGPVLFYLAASVHALLICKIVWRMRTRERPADEDRIEFSDATIIAQTHMPLDPQAGTEEPGGK